MKMSLFLTALLSVLHSPAAFSDEKYFTTAEEAIVAAVNESQVFIKNIPCTSGTKIGDMKISLIQGGGDVLPLQYQYLASQEFNCLFTSSSVFAVVNVSADFTPEQGSDVDFTLKFKADSKSVKNAKIVAE